MQNALTELSKITKKKFFENPEICKSDLLIELEKIYGEPSKLEVEGKDCYIFYSEELRSTIVARFIIPIHEICLIEWYDFLQDQARQKIKEEVYNNLDFKKNAVYIKYTIKELNFFIGEINKFELEDEQSQYKEVIVKRLNDFINELNLTYLGNERFLDNVKIKWLGSKTVLCTLIFELWQGQRRDKLIATKSMIEASKDDLKSFILNNFIDSEGNLFSASTVDDYLNKSKKKPKSAQGVRIEFTTP